MVDKYAGFEALAAGERRNIDFRIRFDERASPVIVLAPHGGRIEPGTSELAEAIAKDDLSFYAFEGIRGDQNGTLHITSHRFDEPDALRLVGLAEVAVALHGRQDRGDPSSIWLGGKATALRDAIATALSEAEFDVAIAEGELAAQHPSNICNRTRSGAGVQLELPRTLRNRLVSNPALLRSFRDAVRKAIADQESAERIQKP